MASESLESTYEALIEFLGYRDSSQYLVSSPDPSLSGFFRVAKQAGVKGAYVIETNTGAYPYICVVTAASETEGRTKRKQLWCIGLTYLTVIVLPGSVRVYTNSQFNDADPSVGCLVEHNYLGNDWPEKLRDISSIAIDSGDTWSSEWTQIDARDRVDRHLLTNLANLSKYLQTQLAVSVNTSHALIGKYIYMRYLRDRGILTDAWLEQQDIDPGSVFSGAATRSGLRALVLALDSRLNGQLFPIDFFAEDAPSDVAVATVASAISGSQPWSEQLQFEFISYDFSFIPVETLSIIYEQFLGEQEAQRSSGAFYTPTGVASYVISEVSQVVRIRRGERVLDPACGSGIFLVLCYRYLIEHRIRESGELPSLDELKEILVTSIFGVEINREACYVTEFSLLLTLLSYVTPPQLEEHDSFKFPDLHNNNIFNCDFFDPDSSFTNRSASFRWIVGNPPWQELDRNDPHSKHCRAYINKLPSGSVFDLRIHEAFVWRALEFADYSSAIGLIILATSLVNSESEQFRRRLFSSISVSRITNFSNFSFRLFPTAGQPATVLVYSPAPPEQGSEIIHTAPFVAEQPQLQRLPTKHGVPFLTLYTHNFRAIKQEDAASGAARVWKEAMWCTYRDEQALGFLRNAFPQTLGELSTSRRWAIQQGLELRPENVTEPIQHVPELQGMQVLDHKLLRGRSNPLQVPGHSLSKLDSQENNVRRGRTAGLRVIHAPHVFFSTNGAIFSDVDFVLRHPQIGISAPSEDRIMLKAVAMLLWSSPFRFLTFFESTSIGISTSTITVSPVRAIPLPSLSSDQASTLAFLYDELADGFEGQLYDGSGNQFGQAAQEKLDQLVNQLLDLPPFVRIAASDFAAIKSHLIRGKRPPEFCRPTSDRELYDYGEVLSQELTEFAGVSHRVRLIRDAGSVNCWVDEGDFGASQIEVLANQNTSPASIDEYRRRRTQWAYVERSIYVVTDSSARIWKSDQRANWTRGQALVDSDQLIADFIQEAGLVKS